MTQAERRLFLIRSLMNEKTEYADLGVPRDADGQRQLLRGLINVRLPAPADEGFLAVQDAYLQRRAVRAVFFGFCGEIRHWRHVFRRVLPVPDAGGVLGVLEPLHLHQPLSGRAEAGV